MSNSSENFIHNLLAQMTLEEKVGQLNQYFDGGEFDPQVVRRGDAGSVINASGALTGQGFSGSGSAEISNHIQSMALESRLKIPLIFGRDVIHGYRTVFPIPLGQAAAFDPQLAEQASAVAAREASADGVHWTFAPMVDIARDARWGRVAEGSGEDPLLGARMAAAAVRGFQGPNPAAIDRIIACAKHYVGYGSAEGGRDYDGGEISEPTLRDVYLPPYKAAVEAGVGTLMSAFLDLNGIPATSNRRLLTDVLRGEWGFDGFVVSDWDSVGELVQHGVAEDDAHAAALALHAGLDMDMVSQVYVNTLAHSVRSGLVPLEEVETAVLRILRIKERAGLFAQPYTDATRAAREMVTAESRALARKFARQSMVLLKNKGGLLPFKNARRVLLAGNFAHATAEQYGTWTADGRPDEVTPLDEAVRAAAPKGVEVWATNSLEVALQDALWVDAIVLVLGEHPRRSGENANVSDLTLPAGQAEWVTAMAGLGKPFALVVFAGRPLAITLPSMLSDALLYAWHPGIEGGAALADLLFGTEAPSGRLPVSLPRATGQAPLYYNHKPSGRPWGPDNEFKTRYIDIPTTPLFPFGFGLSYTTFAYSNLALSDTRLRGSLVVSADVTNSGPVAATEVVQLYTRDLVGSLTRPVRELKDFQRVSLQPGETRRVSFTLREEQLAFTRADGTHGVEPGAFQVWVAPDSASGLMGEFRL